jgi:hypothetical protein
MSRQLLDPVRLEEEAHRRRVQVARGRPEQAQEQQEPPSHKNSRDYY